MCVIKVYNQHFFSSNDILNLSNFNNNNTDLLNSGAPSMLTKSQLQQALIYLLNVRKFSKKFKALIIV